MSRGTKKPVKKGGAGSKNPEDTEKSKKLFLESLERSLGNISKACAAANIGRQTYYKWRKKDPDFFQECQNVRESLIDLSESKLLENIRNNDNTAIIFFLKCHGKHRGYDEKGGASEFIKTQENRILDDLKNGDIDLIAAGLEYAKLGRPLPEVLKIQLQKLEPPDTIDDADVISDEELDAQFEAAKAKVEEQRGQWLEDRRADVALLKAETETETV